MIWIEQLAPESHTEAKNERTNNRELSRLQFSEGTSVSWKGSGFGGETNFGWLESS